MGGGGGGASWIRAPLYASLAKLWTPERMRGWLEKFVATGPRLYDSTYRLAQELGTGEIDVGYGLSHSTIPAIRAGAPVAMALTEPVGVSTLYTGVVSSGANPEGGQVLAAWLASEAGANAYEDATNRGNPFLKGSKAGQFVAGHSLSEWPVDEIPTYVKLLTEYNRILSSRGNAR